MQSRIVIAAGMIFLAGCQRSETITEGHTGPADAFEVPAANYSLSHYFVDTAYISHYEDFFTNDPPRISDPGLQVVRMETWLRIPDNTSDPTALQCTAILNLPSRGSGYDSTLRSYSYDPGRVETGKFIRIFNDTKGIFDFDYAGILTVREFDASSYFGPEFQDEYAVAVAYSRANGKQFGEFTGDDSLGGLRRPRLLTLVRPRYLIANGPKFRDAWKLLVKNIYPIGYTGIVSTYFSLRIVRREGGSTETGTVSGHSFLNVLGLDRYTPDLSAEPPGGDGLFDFKPGFNIDEQRGEIIFPYLRPFDTGMQEGLKRLGLAPGAQSLHLMPELYDSTSSYVRGQGGPSYILKGEALHQ